MNEKERTRIDDRIEELVHDAELLGDREAGMLADAIRILLERVKALENPGH